MTVAPICPYCGQPSKLVDSKCVYQRSYGNIWLCAPCDAYVGVHKNNNKNMPLGRLANKELRDWKIKAHAVFDPMWKSGAMKRGTAYMLLQEIMSIGSQHAHIGMFDVEQCKQLVSRLTEKMTEPKPKEMCRSCRHFTLNEMLHPKHAALNLGNCHFDVKARKTKSVFRYAGFVCEKYDATDRRKEWIKQQELSNAKN